MNGLKRLEKDISNIKLKFYDKRSEYIEWGINLPPFINTFDMLLDEYKRLPTQKEYVEGYIDRYKEYLDSKVSTSDYRALEARLRRAYPSIVRDLHFRTLLKYTDIFDDYSYSKLDDLKYGVDFSVKYKYNLFYLHCYIGTKKSLDAKKIKDKRKFAYKLTDGEHINVILYFDDDKTKKVGDFFLYSKKHLYDIKRKMESIIDEK